MKSIHCAALLIVMMHAPAGAQIVDTAHRWPVAVGARVLVILPRSPDDERLFGAPLRSRLIGRVTATATDTLHIQPGWAASSVALPRSAARSLYVSRGRPRLESALFGALTWAPLGASMDLAAYGYPPDQRSALHARYTVTAAVMGLAAGLIWPEERWRRAR